MIGNTNGIIVANPPDYQNEVNLLNIFPSQPTSSTTTTYTCPYDGWIFMFADRGSSSGNSVVIYIDGVLRYSFPSYYAYATASIMLPVAQGNVISVRTDGTSVTWTIRKLVFNT